jgi:hypothetical protein
MPDFQAWNMTTHPIVRLENDYNNILAHGLDKVATYMVRINGSYYEAIKGGTSSGAGTVTYGGSDNAGSTDGTDCSAVVQAVIDAIYADGGSIYFPADTYPFNTQILIPENTTSLRIFGDCGWSKSENLNNMTPAGTIFDSAVSGDAFVATEFTVDKRSTSGLCFEHIVFRGPDDANSIALEMTNVDIVTVADCAFFDFAYAFYGYFDGTTVAESPGMLDFHDCVISEIRTTPIVMDGFIQSKIHDNEFENWGTYTRHIHLIDTNVIQICNNRFAIGSTSTTEVIYIQTTDTRFCNQIMISDNIVDMGNNAGGVGKYPFIHMDNSTAGPVSKSHGIISHHNLLYYSYTPNTFTDAAYDVVTPLTYGDLHADDYIRIFTDMNSNLKDFSVSAPTGSYYRNEWSPVTLYFEFGNLGNGDSAQILLSKDDSGTQDATVFNYTNNQANADEVNFMIEVPTLWYWKTIVAGGATQDSLWAVYH